MKKVTVTADKETGQAIVLSKKNPDYGYVRVSQTRTVIDDRGWIKNKPVAALILGSVAELQKAGFSAGQELEGKIVIREQVVPFNKKDPEKAEKDLKIAGDTEIVCVFTGELDGESYTDAPIYRKSFYTQKSDMEDTLLDHSNKEVIKAAYAKSLEKAGDLSLD